MLISGTEKELMPSKQMLHMDGSDLLQVGVQTFGERHLDTNPRMHHDSPQHEGSSSRTTCQMTQATQQVAAGWLQYECMWKNTIPM